jgi:hypothetical protein
MTEITKETTMADVMIFVRGIAAMKKIAVTVTATTPVTTTGTTTTTTVLLDATVAPVEVPLHVLQSPLEFLRRQETHAHPRRNKKKKKKSTTSRSRKRESTLLLPSSESLVSPITLI